MKICCLFSGKVGKTMEKPTNKKYTNKNFTRTWGQNSFMHDMFLRAKIDKSFPTK